MDIGNLAEPHISYLLVIESDSQQLVPEPGSRRRLGAMAEEGKVWIEKFYSKDFVFWKMQIEDYFYHKKLHEPLSGKKPEKVEKMD